jgi:competence protein ComEC
MPEPGTPARFAKRPALTCFFACASGVAFARICNAHLLLEIILSAFFIVLAGVTAFFLRSRMSFLSRILGLTAFASFGFLLLTYQEYSFEESLLNKTAAIYSGEVIIYGRVVSNPESSASASFFLETDSLIVDSLTLRSPEKISVTISGIEKTHGNFLPRVGQRVKLFAECEHLESTKNPYEISYDTKGKEHDGIKARAYLHSPYDLYITDSSAQLSTIECAGQFFQGLFEKSKAIIANAIEDSLTKGFVSAVVLGDKTGLNSETLDDFQRAGLTHLLVVSGFNVSIVAILVFYLLKLIGLSYRRLRIGLSMLVVLFYCLVVGLEPSVVRALIVIQFIFISRFLERKPDMGNLTAGAALVTVLLHPYDLFDIGFQLSYGAVFSIIFLYPSFEKLFVTEKIREGKTFLVKEVHRLLQGFFVSLSVFLGLLPVFLFHFHRVSIVGLGINILGIPLAAIITIFGFLLLPISFISQWAASIYGEASLWLTKIIAGVAHFSGKFEWSVIQLPRPQTILIIIYIAALFYLVRSSGRKTFFARSLIISAFVFLLFAVRIPFASSLVRSSEHVSLLFFDVGQGDAMLLVGPNGKSYLIDFGGITKNYSAIADRKIAPLFKAEGIAQLDGGFITHMHIDHYGGAVSMIQGIGCKALYTSGERTTGYAAYRLDSISQALHIPVLRVHEGDKFELDKDLSIFVLNPEATTDDLSLPLSSEGMNHGSLALKVIYKNSSALLLGDIEAQDEERLVNRYGDFLRSDIVKVAHHGSHTSSSQLLVKAAKPEYAVISVGKHNTFGHPTTSVIKRWMYSGASVNRTDKEGALLFQSDGKGFKKINWR